MINQLNDEDDENIYNLDLHEETPILSAQDIDKLRSHIARLKTQLDEEKSNSKQAAEYGLSLLEDSKKLQSKIYELEGEIETTKAELESTNLVRIIIIKLLL